MLYFFIPEDKINLHKSDCHVWHIDIDDRSYLWSLNYNDTLSNFEKEKFLSYKFEEDSKRYLVSHIALRNILSLYTDIPLKLIKFKYNIYGKPYFADSHSTHLFFNLSHAHNKAIITVNNTEVGVDIEYIKSLSDISSVAKIIFSDKENRNFIKLKNPAEKLNYFYNIWTKKEAYLKLLATGLVDDLKNLDIDTVPNSTLQKIHLEDCRFIGHVAFKGSQYKNLINYIPILYQS